MSSLADAWCDASDGDDLQFIGPLLLGQTKWLGAAVMRDGSLVGVPGHARQVLRVDPRLHRVTLLGRSRGQDVNRNGRNVFKWLRGVSVGDKAYGIPMHGDAVLKVTPRVPCSRRSNCWTWQRRVISSGTAASSRRTVDLWRALLREAGVEDHPWTDEVSYFGDLGDAKAKWYGGILGPDGNMYCMPFAATRVLRVVTAEDRCELIGPELTGGGAHGGYKYHGGLLGPDNCVYGFPMNAKTVLRVNCLTGDVCELPLPEDEPFNGGKYNWGGGCVANGCVYGVPSILVSFKDRLSEGHRGCWKPAEQKINSRAGFWVAAASGACPATRPTRVESTRYGRSGHCPSVASQHDKYQGGYADEDGNVMYSRVRPARAQDQGAGTRTRRRRVLDEAGAGPRAPSLTSFQTCRASFRTYSFRERRARAGRHARSRRALRAKLSIRRGGHPSS